MAFKVLPNSFNRIEVRAVGWKKFKFVMMPQTRKVLRIQKPKPLLFLCVSTAFAREKSSIRNCKLRLQAVKQDRAAAVFTTIN